GVGRRSGRGRAEDVADIMVLFAPGATAVQPTFRRSSDRGDPHAGGDAARGTRGLARQQLTTDMMRWRLSAICVKETAAMRKALAGIAALALIGGVAWFVAPHSATAQGGGTVEVEVKYNGPAKVETLKVNKDTEQCGKETK